MQERRLLLEQVEQPAQPVHVRREVVGVQQIALAGDDQRLAFVQRALAGFDRGRHQARDVLAQRLQLFGEARADVVERLAGEVLVEEVGGFGQLRLRVRRGRCAGSGSARRPRP